MPSGYTAGLTTESSFRTFALTCARAFGATIMQRDEPLSAELELPVASDYHAKALAKAVAKQNKLAKMSVSQAEAEAKKHYEQEVQAYQERQAQYKQTRAAYETMLAQVKQWTPPSNDHKGLHEFMRKQLEESIEWDCNKTWDKPPVPYSGEEWLLKARADAEHNIAYHTKGQAEDEQSAQERRDWIIELQKSL